MSDAFKGTNEYVQVVDQTTTGSASALSGGVDSDGKYHNTTKKFIAHSSVAKCYNGAGAPGSAGLSLTGVQIFGHSNGKLVMSKNRNVKIKLPATYTKAEKARVDFQLGILNTINDSLKAHTYLQLKGGLSGSDATAKYQQALAHNETWVKVFGYLGVSIGNKEAVLNKNFLTNSHYRPMVT